MAIHSARNQYMGINVHLNALLQNNRSQWLAFHDAHIDALITILNQILPSHYRAGKALSHQCRTDGDHRFYNLPDSQAQRAARYQAAVAKADKGGPITLPLEDGMGIDVRDFFNAVRIDRIGEDGQFEGAMTWIELLDPLSMPGGPNFERYCVNYTMPDQVWCPLVEIDYIHHHAPMFQPIPQYPEMENASAYRIHVWPWDRRRQRLIVYQFHVDDGFPTIELQLSRDTILPDLKLGEAYNLTFTQNSAYGQWVDYAQAPSDLESFTAVDQQRIRDRMKRIQDAAAQGLDLDANGPFSIES